MKLTIAELNIMVEDCQARESHLTEWEINFIDSLRNRLDADLDLSERQEIFLDRIWTRVSRCGVVER